MPIIIVVFEKKLINKYVCYFLLPWPDPAKQGKILQKIQYKLQIKIIYI